MDRRNLIALISQEPKRGNAVKRNTVYYTRLSSPFTGMISATYRLYLPLFNTGFLEDQRKLVSLLSREEKKCQILRLRDPCSVQPLKCKEKPF